MLRLVFGLWVVSNYLHTYLSIPPYETHLQLKTVPQFGTGTGTLRCYQYICYGLCDRCGYGSVDENRIHMKQKLIHEWNDFSAALRSPSSSLCPPGDRNSLEPG